MSQASYHPLEFARHTPQDMIESAKAFRTDMTRRRTVRDYSSDPVPREIIEHALMTAGTAPSGANQQPWSFAAISSGEIKKRIRLAAEEEEKAFYAGKAGKDWLTALAHLGTDWEKPFLEEAPWLIAIFAQRWGEKDNQKIKHYYVPESVGIATGFLIAALHRAGLATLTHTPSPMGFLNEICGRPESEKAVILLIVGYPKEGCLVPEITKKTIAETTVWL
jgi:iodotyrosine deiodinase